MPTAWGLTPRELDVARLLAQGDTNKQIAGRLSVTTEAVKNHVTAILRKLNVNSRTRAALRLRSIVLDA